MVRTSTLILLLIAALISIEPALAHRPYFTQVEKIRLPNGDMGEARLLNGDGIFGPDPVRVLILDTQSRLLARSPRSYSLSMKCDDDGACLIFDLTNDKVFELEASSIRQGDLVPGLDDDRNGLWELEDGEESWGFNVRSPTLSERPGGLVAILLSHLPIMAVNALIAVVICLLAMAAWFLLRAERTRKIYTLLAMLAAFGIVVVDLYLAFMSWVLSVISGLPFMGLLLSLMSGGGFVFTGYRALKAFRNAHTKDSTF